MALGGSFGMISVAIGVNTTPALAGIAKMDAVFRAADARWTAMMAGIGGKGSGAGLASLGQSFKAFGASASGLIVPVNNIAPAMKNASAATNTLKSSVTSAGTAGGAALTGLGAKAKDTAGKFGVMGVNARALSTDVRRSLTGMTSSLSGVASPLSGVIGALGNWKEMLALAGVAIGVISIKLAVDFNTAMSKVWALTNTSRETFGKWSDEVLKLSTRLPQSATEIGDAFYWVTSNMPDATDTERFATLETAAKGAYGGVSDLSTATKALTGAQNAYKDSDPGHVMDVFSKAVIRGALTMQDFASNQGKYAGAAALAGVSIEETSAAMATLTRNAIPADTAAMALNQTLMSFLKPSKEATETARSYGIELSLAALQSKGLAGALMEIAQNIPDDELTKLFPNIRALKAVLPLTGIAAKEFAVDLAAINDAAGTTDEMFRRMSESFAGQFKTAVNSAKKVLIELGTVVLPMLGSAFKVVTDSVAVFGVAMKASLTAIPGVPTGLKWLIEGRSVSTPIVNLTDPIGSIKAFIDFLKKGSGETQKITKEFSGTFGEFRKYADMVDKLRAKGVTGLPKILFPASTAASLKGVAGGINAVSEAIDRMNTKGGTPGRLFSQITDSVTALKDQLGKVGLKGVLDKELAQMAIGFTDAAPRMRAGAYEMFSAILDAEALALGPEAAAQMTGVAETLRLRFEQAAKLGPVSAQMMNDILTEVMAGAGPISAELQALMDRLRGIASAGITVPIAVSAVTTGMESVKSALGKWGDTTAETTIKVSADTSPAMASIDEVNKRQLDPKKYAANANVSSWANVYLPPKTFVAIPVYPGSELTLPQYAKHMGEVLSAVNATPTITPRFGGGGAGATGFASGLESAWAALNTTALVGWSKDVDIASGKFGEMEQAIVDLGSGPAIGAWRNMRTALDSATASLAEYEKQLEVVDAKVKTLQRSEAVQNHRLEQQKNVLQKLKDAQQKQVDKAQKNLDELQKKHSDYIRVQEKELTDLQRLRDANQKSLEKYSSMKIAGQGADADRSFGQSQEAKKLDLAIMEAEDAHQYALAAKLTLQKEVLERKKQEADLQAEITYEPQLRALEKLLDPLGQQEMTYEQIVAGIGTLPLLIAQQTSAIEAQQLALEITRGTWAEEERLIALSIEALGLETQAMKNQQVLIDATEAKLQKIADKIWVATTEQYKLNKATQDAQAHVTYYSGLVDKMADNFIKRYDEMIAKQEELNKAQEKAAKGGGMISGGMGVPVSPWNAPSYKAPATAPSSTTTVVAPVYLDGKVIAQTVTRIQGNKASSYSRSGGRY